MRQYVPAASILSGPSHFPSLLYHAQREQTGVGRAIGLPRPRWQAYTDEAALDIPRRTERGGSVQETPARAGKQPDSARQLIERARHILTHEQRSGHQDNVVRPGGIEAFIERWATQMHDARDRREHRCATRWGNGAIPGSPRSCTC